MHALYISTAGKNSWSGRLAEPNADGSDGPLATIDGARQIVRRWKESGQLDGSVTVWLRGGRYPLRHPLVFKPEDSGPITYAAYEEEQPILDGGRRIEGWQVEEQNGQSIWVADLPEVMAGTWYFHQLWVNGERRQRPRLPKEGFYWIEDVPGLKLEGRLTDNFFNGNDTFVSAEGDIQAWQNLNDVDVVVVHYWIEERMPIESFEPETRTVRSARRSMFILRDDVALRYAKYYVENVFEALTEPGEWYLDRSSGRLHYIPMPGETLETAEIFAPVAEQLLVLRGDPDAGKYVEYLRFQGITFEHTEWQQPESHMIEGFEEAEVLQQRPHSTRYAAAPQAACNLPGAIQLEGARYCAIEECTIRHIGLYGILLSSGCRGNRIVGNEVTDLGAGGIRINGAHAHGPVERRTGQNRITDNHIYAGGRVFHSAIGVLMMHTFGNRVAHNHIHDFYYSGVSCGWVWGYAENVTKNNQIEFNYIHDLGHGLLSDMGGIYTLGVQPGTVLRGNVIHDVEKCNYGGWAIYLDEGSSHILVENNLCYNTSSQPFNQHYGRENIVRNNIFAFGREGQVSLGRAEEHTSFNLYRNIIVTSGQPVLVGGNFGQLDRQGLQSNLNLYWDVTGSDIVSGDRAYDAQARIYWPRTYPLVEMQAMGYDQHSVVADPGFANVDQLDFTLPDESAAQQIGFRPFDPEQAGPRLKGKRST
jgi:hypothetical protein